MKILLVEDNPDDLELSLTALKQYRPANQVDVCRDGKEALEYLFDRPSDLDAGYRTLPEVVLLDLKLPRVNGLEVLAKAKNDERTRHIPIIMMTASNEESDVVESYRLGVNSYIVKPMEFDSFVKAMRAIGYYWLLLNRGAAQRWE